RHQRRPATRSSQQPPPPPFSSITLPLGRVITGRPGSQALRSPGHSSHLGCGLFPAGSSSTPYSIQRIPGGSVWHHGREYAMLFPVLEVIKVGVTHAAGRRTDTQQLPGAFCGSDRAITLARRNARIFYRKPAGIQGPESRRLNRHRSMQLHSFPTKRCVDQLRALLPAGSAETQLHVLGCKHWIMQVTRMEARHPHLITSLPRCRHQTSPDRQDGGLAAGDGIARGLCVYLHTLTVYYVVRLIACSAHPSVIIQLLHVFG
ncbi:hypothetical protein B0T14DRAFT_503662, partial [Immersiella caudata]